MSPFFGSKIIGQNQKMSQMFLSEEQFELQNSRKTKQRIKKPKDIKRQRSNSQCLFDQPSAQLDKIIQQDQWESSQSYQDSNQNGHSLEKDKKNLQQKHHFSQSKAYKAIELENKDIQFEKQLTNFSTFSEGPFTHLNNSFFKPKLLNQIKAIVNSLQEQITFQQKSAKIQQNLSQYLFQFQIQEIVENWNQIQGQRDFVLLQIVKNLDSLFNRKLGPISFENHRVKLFKYLQKKKRRIWKKKVSYDCRRKVADGRLRIKGKFVTKDQICQQFGLQNLQLSSSQLKALLSSMDGQLGQQCKDRGPLNQNLIQEQR